MDFQRVQLRQPLLDLFRAEAAGRALNHQRRHSLLTVDFALHFEDPVEGIGETHLHRHLARRARWNIEREFVEQDIFGHPTRLALEHGDLQLALVVVYGRDRAEHADRHKAVALNNGQEIAALKTLAMTTRGFDAERIGHDVGQHDVVERGIEACEPGLNARAQRHHFIRVQFGAREAAKHARRQLAHHRHARGTAHQDNVVQIADIKTGVAQRLNNRLLQARQQRLANVSKQVVIKPPRHFLPARVERGRRQRLLCQLVFKMFSLFGQPRFFEGIRRTVVRVTRQHPLADNIGKVIAAEARVAAAGAHFNHAFKHIDDGNVKGAAAEIEHQKFLLAVFGKAIGERRRRRFIDQPLHLEPRQMPRRFDRFTLNIVKPRRNGNHRARDRDAKRHFGIGFQFAQHQRRKLFRAKAVLAEDKNFVGAHVAFKAGVRERRMTDQPRFRRRTDDDMALVVQADDRRREHAVIAIGNQRRTPIGKPGHRAVRRA
ncbi:putative NAD-specific glutamate dehydrogenase [Cronobacter dublinensis 582]|nr:putative NAD-specific glutamate dehydrogenase [Cronobacter dublinensis 582]